MSVKFDPILGKIRENDAFSGSYNDLQDLPTLGTLSSQNGTFSGGGTLATGGFTLTVPATGTAALLSRANVFTEAQTIQKDLPLGIYNNTNTAAYSAFRFQESGVAAASIQQIGSTFATATRQNNLELFNHTATGQITMWTNATMRMTITAAGLVGIANSSPAYALDVTGVGNFTGGLRVDASQNSAFDALYFRNSSTGNAALTRASFRSNAGEQLIIDVFGSGYSGSISGINYANLVAIRARTNTSGLMIGTESTDPFYFITNNSVRATLDSSGNFGIGGTPTQKLHVIGTGDLSLRAENASFKLDFGVDSTSAFLQSRTAANAAAPLYLYTGSTAKMVIDSTGNVGIGTTAPAGKFDAVVDGNGGIFRRFGGSPSMQFARANGTLASPTQVNSATTIGAFGATALDDTSVYRTVALIRFNSEGAITSTSAPGSVTIQTTPSGSVTSVDRVVIDSAGKVGIGTTSPSAKLHIDQSSTTAAIPVLTLDQADLSEEFIRFVSTVGAGNPIDTAAIGTYYGKVRVYVEGVGAKFIALYNS